MANPTNLDGFDFYLSYTVAQGDPEDPNTAWDFMRVSNGSGQAGLDQAQYQAAFIQQAIDSGQAPNVRDVKVQYASVVQYTDWEAEDTGAMTTA